MDDLLADLTDALQSRIWAAFRKLNHRLRKTKQIDWTECVREAYLVCARELPSELALALLVRYGMALKWLAACRLTGRPVVPTEPSPLELQERAVSRMRGGSAFAKPGWMASPPSPGYEPIPEAEWREVIAKQVVADLIADWQAEALTPAAIPEAAAPEADPPEDRARQKRERLLARARSKHGIVDDIAHKLGKSKPTIYRWLQTGKPAGVGTGLRRITDETL